MADRGLPPRGQLPATFSLESKQLSGPLTMSAAGHAGEKPPVYLQSGFEMRDWLLSQGRTEEAHDMVGLTL